MKCDSLHASSNPCAAAAPVVVRSRDFPPGGASCLPAKLADTPVELSAVPGAGRAYALTTLPEDALVTTKEAAALLGFRSTSAVRKAYMEGRIRPAGRRGSRRTHVWQVGELRRFMRGIPPT